MTSDLMKAADELAEVAQELSSAKTAMLLGLVPKAAIDHAVWEGVNLAETALQAYRDARESAGDADLVDRVLDAANDYMKEHYGIGAMGHPVDRSRIRSALEAE